MEQENIEQAKENKFLIPASIVIAAIIVAWATISTSGSTAPENLSSPEEALAEQVMPTEGVVLPIQWGDLGMKLTATGVIDTKKLESLYAERGGLPDEAKRLLETNVKTPIAINQENAPVILNILWALGLGNKNPILENGEMADPRYGGAGNFASTGGWTLSTGDPMDHYSRHPFVVLTPEQQTLVDRVSRGIYRPCCGNSTHFPDCNHGMAMLGLLELMAANGVGEEEMYKTALAVNSYWFPSTYLTIAKYFQSQGVSWDKVNPKIVLGEDYSSAGGFAKVRQAVAPVKVPSGGGCSA